jgi:hypothetical protein
MMKAMMGFTFPDVADAVWKEQLSKHILFVIFNVILYTIPFKSFREEFRWFNNLRFEKTRKGESYLFVSTTETSFLTLRC